MGASNANAAQAPNLTMKTARAITLLLIALTLLAHSAEAAFHGREIPSRKGDSSRSGALNDGTEPVETLFTTKSTARASRSGFRTRPGALWPLPQSVSAVSHTPMMVNSPTNFTFGLLTSPQSATHYVKDKDYDGRVDKHESLRASIPLLERAFVRYSAYLFGAAPSIGKTDKNHARSVDEEDDNDDNDDSDVRHKQRNSRTQQHHARNVESAKGAGPTLSGLRVKVQEPTKSGYIQLDTDESYSLWVNASSQYAVIEAKTEFGALRGLETFSQLFYGSGLGGGNGDIFVQQKAVHDFPRFSWRGLLVDTARHFLPIATLKRLIDGMPFNKLNTFHWHVVDGQSFPLISTAPKSYKLSLGAYAPDLVYRPEDVTALIEYANDRGVRILPEFDMPAHATSWGYGYPNLVMNCSRFQGVCVPPPHAPHNYDDGCGDAPFNPIAESTYELLNDFLSEMAGRFPDNWVHLGGDELTYRIECWNTTAINDWMQANSISNYFELEGYFIKRVQAITDESSKQVLHWQEIFNNHISMPKNRVMIHVWKDHATLDSVVNAGFRGILSFGWYLDHLDTSWSDMYSNEPIDSTLSPESAKRVLGGEACMWAESVDENNIESRIWPRTSAVAERLWSAKSVANVANAQTRLHDQRCRMIERGVLVEPFQPGWCY